MPGDLARAVDRTHSAADFASVLPVIVVFGLVVVAARLLGGPLALPVLSVLFVAAAVLSDSDAALLQLERLHTSATVALGK